MTMRRPRQPPAKTSLAYPTDRYRGLRDLDGMRAVTVFCHVM
jgi:hypothetical protein